MIGLTSTQCTPNRFAATQMLSLRHHNMWNHLPAYEDTISIQLSLNSVSSYTHSSNFNGKWTADIINHDGVCHIQFTRIAFIFACQEQHVTGSTRNCLFIFMYTFNPCFLYHSYKWARTQNQIKSTLLDLYRMTILKQPLIVLAASQPITFGECIMQTTVINEVHQWTKHSHIKLTSNLNKTTKEKTNLKRKHCTISKPLNRSWCTLRNSFCDSFQLLSLLLCSHPIRSTIVIDNLFQ